MAIKQVKRGWRIDYRDTSGKRYRETFPSNEQARKMLSKRQAEIFDGEFRPHRATARRTVGEILDKYALHRQRTEKKATSWQHSGRYVHAEVKAQFGGLVLAGVTVDALQQWYDAKARATSPTTANRTLKLLSAAIEYARKIEEYHGGNPCAKVDALPDNDARTRFLEPHEIRALFTATAGTRLYPIVACALCTGMRQDELLSLDWAEVSLSRHEINLPGRRTKAGRARPVSIRPDAAALLLALGPKASGPVFGLSLSTLKRDWDKAREAAALKDFHFHDLRRTFGVYYYKATPNLEATRQALGHATLAMTQRYLGITDGDRAQHSLAFQAVLPLPDSLTALAGPTQAGPAPLALDVPNQGPVGHFLDTVPQTPEAAQPIAA